MINDRVILKKMSLLPEKFKDIKDPKLIKELENKYPNGIIITIINNVWVNCEEMSKKDD